VEFADSLARWGHGFLLHAKNASLGRVVAKSLSRKPKLRAHTTHDTRDAKFHPGTKLRGKKH